MADIFDVIADATRRELLTKLLERDRESEGVGEASVGDLVAELGISQPTVSKHLRVLREHGVVTVREEGQHRYYRISPRPLAEVDEWLTPFVDSVVGVPSPEILASAAYQAWSGADIGDKLGKAAALAAYQARVAVDGAQDLIHDAGEKLHEAQDFVGKKLPGWAKKG